MDAAVVYTRVSTVEQTANLSLSTQEEACRDYCRRQGWTVAAVFTEAGESAKTADRTKLNELLLYCRQHRGRVRFVVVYALSRFARDTHDHHVLRAHLAQLGVGVRSATEPVEDNSAGRFVESILAAAAQLDNDMRAERVVAGMKAAAARGRWTFQAALGYLNGRDAMGAAVLVPDPDRAELVRQAFRMAAEGKTIYEITDTMKGLGLKTRKGNHVLPQGWAKILRKPIYKGIVDVAGWAPATATFDPLVSPDLFDRVQGVLARRRHKAVRHRRLHPDFPLRGHVRCSCGRPLTGSWVRGRTKRYAYYSCPASCISTRKEKLEEIYLETLSDLAPAPELMRLFKAVVLDAYRSRQEDARRVVADVDRRLGQLEKRKARLEDAYLYDQTIDRDTYTRHSDRLSEEIALARLGRHDAEIDGLDVEALLAFAEFMVLNPGRLWQEAGPEQKARLQAFMVPTGLTWDGERVGTVATGLFFSRLAGETSGGGALVGLQSLTWNQLLPLLHELEAVRVA